MLTLQDTYQLIRTGSYSNPRSTGGFLPIVWGDLSTGGAHGVWEIPCIDTVNFVYAFAGTAVLSAGDGNSITIYDKDWQVIDPGDYTFDESDVFEGLAAIAKITFTGDKSASEPIYARGMGRASGSTLIENPVDIVEDFLNNLCGYVAGDWDTTSLERARAAMTANSYAAAGVLNSERSLSETLTEVLTCFGVDWRLSPSGNIFLLAGLGTDDNTQYQLAYRFRPHETKYASLEVSLDGVCNQASCDYAYNWAKDIHEDSESGVSGADDRSQALYGPRIRNFQWAWIRSATVAAARQAQIVSEYKDPRWLATLTSPGTRAVHVEQGDYVGYSSNELFDAQGQRLRNQIYQVWTVQPDLDVGAVQFQLRDTGRYLTTRALATEDGDIIITEGGDEITEESGGKDVFGYPLAGGDRDMRD